MPLAGFYSSIFNLNDFTLSAQSLTAASDNLDMYSKIITSIDGSITIFKTWVTVMFHNFKVKYMATQGVIFIHDTQNASNYIDVYNIWAEC